MAWRCTAELFSDISLPFYLFSTASYPLLFFQMHACLQVQMWVHDHYYQNTEDTEHICWTNGQCVETRMLFLIVNSRWEGVLGHAPTIWHFWLFVSLGKIRCYQRNKHFLITYYTSCKCDTKAFRETYFSLFLYILSFKINDLFSCV